MEGKISDEKVRWATLIGAPSLATLSIAINKIYPEWPNWMVYGLLAVGLVMLAVSLYLWGRVFYEYIKSKTRYITLSSCLETPKAVLYLSDAYLAKFTQAAYEGAIICHGKSNVANLKEAVLKPYVEIPKEFWQNHFIDLEKYYINHPKSANADIRTKAWNDNVGEFSDIYVNEAQFKKWGRGL